DVPKLVDEALGPKASIIAAPLNAAFSSVVSTASDKVVSSKQFDRLWVAANRDAHSRLMKALEGSSNAPSSAVAVDLSGGVAKVAAKLQSLGVPVPLTNSKKSTTLELYSSEQIAKVRGFYHLAILGSSVLPWLAIVLLIGAVFVAPDRRRGALGAGIALAVGGALLLIGFAVTRAVFLDAVSGANATAAAAALFDTLVRFVRGGTRTVVAVGVVVGIAAWAGGPSAGAVGLRRALGRATNAAGDAAASHGADGGAVGRWVAQHTGVLRGLIGVVCALLLVLWSQPTAMVVVWMGVGAVAALLVIEVLARSATSSAGAPATSD
ncbi:MAG: hypothetical protein ACKOYM_00735, partial [Actinomycetes bacterium]